MSTVSIQVLRAFSVGGERQEVGSTLDVSPSLAAELFANHKAKPAEQSAAEAEANTETPAKPVRSRKEKTE